MGILNLPTTIAKILLTLTMTGFTILAFKAYQDEQKYTIALYITLASIFQPIIDLQVDKTIWNMLLILVAGWLGTTVWLQHRIDQKREK